MDSTIEYIREEIIFRMALLQATTTYRPMTVTFEKITDLMITDLEYSELSHSQRRWIEKDKDARIHLLAQVDIAFQSYVKEDECFQRIGKYPPRSTPPGEWMYDFHEKYVKNLAALQKYKEHLRKGLRIFKKGFLAQAKEWIRCKFKN